LNSDDRMLMVLNICRKMSMSTSAFWAK